MSRKQSIRTPFSIIGSVADWLARPQSQICNPARQGKARSSRRRLGYEGRWKDAPYWPECRLNAVIQGTVTNSATSLGQSNVTIDLTPTGGSTISTTTNAAGFYSFTRLPAGTYKVTEVPPAGFSAPSPNPKTVVITSPDTIAGNIDTFTTPQTAMASSAGPARASRQLDCSDIGSALGGNRDLTSEIVSGSGTFTLASNEFGTAGL